MERPECNYPITFRKLVNEEVGNQIVNGYSIEVRDVHPGWMTFTETQYVLYYVGGGDLILKQPSCTWSEIMDPDAEKRSQDKSRAGPDPITLQQDKAHRAAILEDESRQHVYTLLRWPSTTFDNSIYSPQARNGEVVVNVCGVKSQWTLRGKARNEYRLTLKWKIAVKRQGGDNPKLEAELKSSANDQKDQMETLFLNESSDGGMDF